MSDKTSAVSLCDNDTALQKARPLLQQLSSDWEAIERALSKQGILRECSVAYRPYQADRQEPAIGEYHIGIRKLGGVWRVCYGVFDFRGGEVDSWTPVSDASITIRIELLDHVETLRQRIIASNKEFVGVIENAVEKSRAVVEGLLGGKNKDNTRDSWTVE